MAMQTFDFEKPIVEIENRIEALKASFDGKNADIERRILALEKQRDEIQTQIYGNLTPWQRIQIARHMLRPRSLDFIRMMTTDWHEIKGDRNFRDDPAVVCGLARINGEPVAIIGQQKGKDTRENVIRNFGMMHPEGYRKAMRLMRLAERFKLPIICLIDTPGAYPGIGAEERGQAEAIARNIMDMFTVRTPIIGVIIGEGASGGALGIGVVDYMIMLENSWYCVISPEGCSSILWRDAAMAPKAADALKLTSDDLLTLKVVDESIPEPLGGAHRDPQWTAERLSETLQRRIAILASKDTDQLLKDRFEKFRHIGIWAESK